MKEQLEALEKECDVLMERLTDYMVSPAEAQELANRFLSMTYRVNHQLRDINNELIKLSVLDKMAYKTAFDKVDAKANVSKAKAEASADKEYLKNSIALQRLENDKDYWKGVYDIFEKGHLFYKMLTRD